MHGISKAERFIADRFFCNDTGLIYDFLVDDGNAWHHLPSPEDIKKQNPNPCGWGVGMEDSMLNAGSVMDALIARFYATGEEKIKNAMLYSKDLKDRYSVLWLYFALMA